MAEDAAAELTDRAPVGTRATLLNVALLAVSDDDDERGPARRLLVWSHTLAESMGYPTSVPEIPATYPATKLFRTEDVVQQDIAEGVWGTSHLLEIIVIADAKRGCEQSALMVVVMICEARCSFKYLSMKG